MRVGNGVGEGTGVDVTRGWRGTKETIMLNPMLTTTSRLMNHKAR